MARKAKVDNSVIKRLARVDKARSIGILDQRKYFLIVCEGEQTEPNYFEGLKQDLPPNVLTLFNIDVEGTGKNTTSLVRYAISKQKSRTTPYDEVWVVFDRDSFTPIQFNSAIKQAEEKKINVAWTNEAFELWYLLHFNYHDSALNRNQYQKKLEKEISLKSGMPFKYRKNDKNIYSLLKEHGNQKLAISNATKLNKIWLDKNFASHNPCTTVHVLVKKHCSLTTLRLCN